MFIKLFTNGLRVADYHIYKCQNTVVFLQNKVRSALDTSSGFWKGIIVNKQIKMGMVQKRKKMHSGDTHLRRRWRVRSRKRDLDEVC